MPAVWSFWLLVGATSAAQAGEAALRHDRLAMRVADALRYVCPGSTPFMLANEMPHGGMRQSGYGKDMSLYGLEDYTVVNVMVAH